VKTDNTVLAHYINAKRKKDDRRRPIRERRRVKASKVSSLLLTSFK
jgi:hypothetical protein